MSEYVHLLLGELEAETLSPTLQVVKHRTARRVHDVIRGQIWHSMRNDQDSG